MQNGTGGDEANFSNVLKRKITFPTLASSPWFVMPCAVPTEIVSASVYLKSVDKLPFNTQKSQ